MSEDPTPRWQDGFRADEDDPEAPHLVFTERMGDHRGTYYIHGALHLYVVAGEVRKHSWTRTGVPLTDLVTQGLEQGQYPLFVAEGTAEKKIEQIRESGYLSYCLGKLGRITHRLVVFGQSFGPSDRHILETLAYNRQLRHIWVSMHGAPDSLSSQAVQASAEQLDRMRRDLGHPDLTVRFYSSESAGVWR
jgi:hypothetical protein